MRQLQKVRQYQRLYRFTGTTPVSTTIYEMSSLLLCSERHTRTLLKQLSEKGWLTWHATPGRGNKGTLHCLVAISDICIPLMQTCLEKGDYQSALLLAEGDPANLHHIISPFLGMRWHHNLPTLRIPLKRSVLSLQPALTCRRAEQHIIACVHAGLTRFEPDNPAPVPDLAHHWFCSDDKLSWVFVLRNGVHWHNGQLIQPEEILKALEQALNNPLRSPALPPVSDISLDTAGHLRIQLARPDAFLAHHLANPLFRLPHPSEPDTGAGPFVIARHSSHYLRLEKQPWYYDRQPLLHAVEFWTTQVEASGMSALPSARMSVGKSGIPGVQRPAIIRRGQGFVWMMSAASLPMNLRNYLLLQATELARSLFHGRKDISFTSPLIPSPGTDILTELPLPSLPTAMTLLCYDSPEVRRLADTLVRFCHKLGCRLFVRTMDREHWYHPDTFTGVDLILGDHPVGECPTLSCAEWLYTEPAWQHMLDRDSFTDAASRLEYILASRENIEHRVLSFFHHLFIEQACSPLFRYNYHITPLENVADIVPTADGWFDFSRVWLPALPPEEEIPPFLPVSHHSQPKEGEHDAVQNTRTPV